MDSDSADRQARDKALRQAQDKALRQAQDRLYFTRRAEEERSAAASAQGKARQAHEQMAERYGILSAEGSQPGQPQPAATAEADGDETAPAI